MVYVDLVLLLNFFYDFLLLLTTSVILKRNAKIFRVILGAFIGGLSIIVLFFKFDFIQIFLIKIYLSIIMCLITFDYKDFKYLMNNILTFYFASILLGGFLYLLTIETNIKTIFLFILSPIILYIYVRQAKNLKNQIKNYYKVDLYLNNQIIALTGYLDTGNNLSYNGKPVILINRKIKTNKKKVLVPYISLGTASILECISAKVYVYDLGEFEVLIGYSNINISGVDILLNNGMEG